MGLTEVGLEMVSSPKRSGPKGANMKGEMGKTAKNGERSKEKGRSGEFRNKVFLYWCQLSGIAIGSQSKLKWKGKAGRRNFEKKVNGDVLHFQGGPDCEKKEGYDGVWIHRPPSLYSQPFILAIETKLRNESFWRKGEARGGRGKRGRIRTGYGRGNGGDSKRVHFKKKVFPIRRSLPRKSLREGERRGKR